MTIVPAKKKALTKNKKATQKRFMTFQFTTQTVYWLILMLLVLALATWVLQLTIQTQEIYDKVQYLNASS